jgi:hypothetical protein
VTSRFKATKTAHIEVQSALGSYQGTGFSRAVSRSIRIGLQPLKAIRLVAPSRQGHAYQNEKASRCRKYADSTPQPPPALWEEPCMLPPDFKKMQPEGAAGNLVGWPPRGIHLFKHWISQQIRCSHQSNESYKQANFDRIPVYLHNVKKIMPPIIRSQDYS